MLCSSAQRQEIACCICGAEKGLAEQKRHVEVKGVVVGDEATEEGGV